MKNIIIEKINNLGADASYSEYNNCVEICLNDFVGFDEDWSEISRDYDNPSAVAELLEFLSNNAKEVKEEFYTFYNFDDFNVVVGYASFDI